MTSVYNNSLPKNYTSPPDEGRFCFVEGWYFPTTFEVSTEVLTTSVLTLSLNFPIAIVAGVLNGLIILAVCTSERSLRRSSLSSLVCCMCFTDFAVAVIVEPCFFVRRYLAVDGVENCLLLEIYLTLARIFGGFSFLLLPVISLERCFCVFRPVQHRNYLSRKKTVGTVFVTWSFVLVIIFVGINGPFSKYTTLILTIIIVLSMTICAVCYGKIFLFIRRQSYITRPFRMHNVVEAAQQAREKRATQTMIIIMAVILLCYLPLMVLFAIRPQLDEVEYLHIYGPYADTIVYVNSCLNVIIYCAKNPKMKQDVKRITKKCCSLGTNQ